MSKADEYVCIEYPSRRVYQILKRVKEIFTNFSKLHNSTDDFKVVSVYPDPQDKGTVLVLLECSFDLMTKDILKQHLYNKTTIESDTRVEANTGLRVFR